MTIKHIGIIGSGTMGGGIAQVAAQSGFDVILYDVESAMLARAISNLTSTFNKLVEKGKLKQEEAEATLARITTATSLNDLAGCDFIIEAAPEKLDLKQSLFSNLESLISDQAILATNTSTLSVTQIASGCKRPQNVVGMHFFNPAPLLPLVEVIATAVTADAVVTATLDLAKHMGKTAVQVKDVPGFIVNRVARPFYLEALRLLEEGVADHATLDKLIRDGGGFRMGPFELMDLIGLDINYAASLSVYESYFYEPRYRPSLAQQRMVESGRLGRKTGRGWYDYNKNEQ
ncbi:MAG: 3-hydroxybutyryl-CoA dehydrogenase [Chloroflexi bacterium]|nr:3-hydroxybutyryl-CoA dehydrogenase [Chloroflexota bacterium]